MHLAVSLLTGLFGITVLAEDNDEESETLDEEIIEEDFEEDTSGMESSEIEVPEENAVSNTGGLQVTEKDDVRSGGEIGEAFNNLSGISTYASSSNYDDIETVQLSGTCDYSSAYKVLNLVSKERKTVGLSSLTMDKDLLSTAMQRAAECNIYLDSNHLRPSGYSCSTVSSKISWRKYCMHF